MAYQVRCNDCGLDHITYGKKAKQERDFHKRNTGHDIPDPIPLNLRIQPTMSGSGEEIVDSD